MNLYKYLLGLVFLLSTVAAVGKRADTTTKTTSKTTVWVTKTTKGKVTTEASIYSQSFRTTYSDATSSATSGDIGLGTISGSVGGIKSYKQTTVKQSNAGEGLSGSQNVYGGLFGLFVIMVGVLM